MGFIEISQKLMGLAETYWDLLGFNGTHYDF